MTSWKFSSGMAARAFALTAMLVAFAAPAADTTPPTISSVRSGSLTSSSAKITWTTNEPATSQVEYGTTTAYGSVTILDSALLTAHAQTISGLKANTKYNYRVVSTDAAGNTARSANYTFTTSKDTTAPTISGVTASKITTTSATVFWTTSEPATGQVESGKTTSYGTLTTLDGALVKSHSQLLSGLTAATLYHYRVISKDSAGNTKIGTDATFTTASSDPVVYNDTTFAVEYSYSCLTGCHASNATLLDGYSSSRMTHVMVKCNTCHGTHTAAEVGLPKPNLTGYYSGVGATGYVVGKDRCLACHSAVLNKQGHPGNPNECISCHAPHVFSAR